MRKINNFLDMSRLRFESHNFLQYLLFYWLQSQASGHRFESHSMSEKLLVLLTVHSLERVTVKRNHPFVLKSRLWQNLTEEEIMGKIWR